MSCSGAALRETVLGRRFIPLVFDMDMPWQSPSDTVRVASAIPPEFLSATIDFQCSSGQKGLLPCKVLSVTSRFTGISPLCLKIRRNDEGHNMSILKNLHCVA